MVKYNTSKYNIGDLVTIVSTKNSSPNHLMINMIGHVYPIQGIPDHTSCIINNFYWSSKDIKKFHPDKENKENMKPKKFNVNNLLIEEQYEK